MTEPLTTSCGLSARSDAKRHICPIRNLVTLLVQYRYVLCYETKPYMIGSGQDSAKHPSEATMSEPTRTVTCKYPGCEASPDRTGGPGRPAEYCADPGHNKVSAWRERRRLADAEHGVTTTEAEAEQPVTMARISGAEMLRQMRDLAGTLAAVADRLTGAVTTLGHPTAAEAEVESARAAAEQRAATAEAARADAGVRGAAADPMRSAADEAAEEMSEHLAAEQARARDAHDRLAEAIEAHAAALERVRADAQASVDAAAADRDAAIAPAQADKATAIEAARE